MGLTSLSTLNVSTVLRNYLMQRYIPPVFSTNLLSLRDYDFDNPVTLMVYRFVQLIMKNLKVWLLLLRLKCTFMAPLVSLTWLQLTAKGLMAKTPGEILFSYYTRFIFGPVDMSLSVTFSFLCPSTTYVELGTVWMHAKREPMQFQGVPEETEVFLELGKWVGTVCLEKNNLNTYFY